MDPANWVEISTLLGEALEITDRAERTAFLDKQCPTATVRAEVENLLAEGETLEETALGVQRWRLAPGELIGPYRILDEVGSGGMGVVYRAERADGQFQRIVAIKIIAESLMSRDAMRRFQAERQILAALRHPNITELLDAGVTPYGSPYLVMEFVDGEPIVNYCLHRGLSIRQRIALFHQVCLAVHYAHQRLVIHRDLKPANILVNHDGSPKLLDFGVARLLDSGSLAEETRDVHRFTPNYASPEQMRGERVLSTSTDIYSLGVVLYHLLTGESPYDVQSCTFEEALHIVNTQDPIAPSARVAPSLAHQIPVDLDAIVQKAMEKKCENRYVSAQELAQDLERFLEGRPVSAQPRTRLYVVRKFVRRNKRQVAAAAVMLGMAVASVVAILHQYQVANRERDKAERRFQQVRQLANSILFEFQPDLAKLAGAMEIRQKMIARSLEHLELLSREATEIALRRELAVAYSRLGDLQGGVNWSLGDRDGAFRSYTQARTLLEAILNQEPANRQAKSNLRVLIGRMAAIADHAGWRERADQLFAENERLTRQLYDQFPNDSEAIEAMANVLFHRVRKVENPAQQLSLLKESLALFQRLLDREPASTKRMYDVAVLSKTLASSFRTANDTPQAAVYAQRAAELDRARMKADPHDARARLDYTFSLSMLAFIEKSTNMPHAVELFRELVAIRKDLWDQEPQNSRLRNAYFSGLNQLANALSESGAHPEPTQLYRQIVQLLERHGTQEPENQKLLEYARKALAKKKQGAIQQNP